MNELREMVIHKDSCEVFEKHLSKLGFQFSKDKEPWFLNKNCSVYHYSCTVWQNIKLLDFLRDNNL